MEPLSKSRLKCPRLEWNSKLEDFPLENFPDYEPGKPPRFEKLAELGHLEEYEKLWGRQCGEQGIGRLREVALVRPNAYEMDPLFLKNPEFFLMRHMMLTKTQIDIGRVQENFDRYVEILKGEGVKVNVLDHDTYPVMGVYGPLRK